MKHLLFACCFLGLLAGQKALSQEKPFVLEGGLSFNAMNALTDLGGKPGIGRTFIKDLNIGYTYFSLGLYAGALYDSKVGLRVEGTLGKLSAHDSVLRNVKTSDIARARYNRNLGYRSNIKEIALIGEVHFYYLIKLLFDSEAYAPRYSPYLLGGIGYFSFKPQTKLGDNWIDLQPLHTEGQGFKEYPGKKNYKLNQVNAPLGGGIKFNFSNRLTIRGEFILRKLFTDYLDDLSTTYINPAVFSNYLTGADLANALVLHDRQLIKVTDPNGGSKRGTATQNDSYFTFNLKAGLTFGRQGGSSLSQLQKRQLSCPKFF
ncbi:MAG: hypothetical protein ABIO05_06675 [Ferruginibacter sp.]